MRSTTLFLLLIALFLSSESRAQPYADIVSFSYQTFSGSYETSPNVRNKTDNYFFGFFMPKVFKNGNTLLLRLNAEHLNSTYWVSSNPEEKYPAQLSSISLPIGFKFVSKNKKWETISIGIPKVAARQLGMDNYALQYGGIFLEQFVASDKLKVKAGLYYNKEAFGNFFVPLVAVDWKINDRVYLYGVLPTNYKAEFNILREKLYTGVNFKSLTRSFTMGDTWNNDYVRYDEMQLKLFVDYFLYKKFLIFGEVGYTIGKSPIQYHNEDDLPAMNLRYTPMKNYLLVNVGFAYRVRLDFAKKEEIPSPQDNN